MKRFKVFICSLTVATFMACTDDNSKVFIATSFHGQLFYEENLEPVTNGELFIFGTDSRGFFSAPILPITKTTQIKDGTFNLNFNATVDIDKYNIRLNIFPNDSTILTFFGGDEPDDLKCLQKDCRDFEPGHDYELTLLVPFSP